MFYPKWTSPVTPTSHPRLRECGRGDGKSARAGAWQGAVDLLWNCVFWTPRIHAHMNSQPLGTYTRTGKSISRHGWRRDSGWWLAGDDNQFSLGIWPLEDWPGSRGWPYAHVCLTAARKQRQRRKAEYSLQGLTPTDLFPTAGFHALQLLLPPVRHQWKQPTPEVRSEPAFSSHLWT